MMTRPRTDETVKMIRAYWVVMTLLYVGTKASVLPGIKPRSFLNRERVELLVSKVTSTKTQIPYSYYSLPYCQPKKKTLFKTKRSVAETTTETEVGEETRQSPYELFFKVPEACKVLCRKIHSRAEMRLFRAVIDNDYRAGLYLDGLPVHDTHGRRGFPIGFAMDLSAEEAEEASPGVVSVDTSRRHFLYNHARFTVSYHETETAKHIVGFHVEPFSIAHDWDESERFDAATTTLEECNDMRPATHDATNFQSADEVGEVIYTYDVQYLKSDTKWSQRWDVYLRASPDDEIHYFSIINSLMIVLFLTGVVAMILLRTLKKDITAYNAADDEEESGWKLVHGDVFRPPATLPDLLAVFVGAGAQLLASTFSVLMLALLGFLSPANRGSLVYALLFLFLAFEGLNGYASASIAKFFSENHTALPKSRRRFVTFLAFIFYPLIIGIALAFLSTVVRAQGGAATEASFVAGRYSSSFPTVLRRLFSGLFLFFAYLIGFALVAYPLVSAGTYFGGGSSSTTSSSMFGAPPTRVNRVPRAVPAPAWYAHPLFMVPFGGILPFGAVCIELFFVMSALWLQQIYYVFGFLLVVLFILVATCAEMTIVLTYFQLCHEDYRWQWRSFLASGSAALYLLMYAIWYFYAKLDITGTAPALLYFGYMAIIAFTFFLLTGAIGFLAAIYFTLTIYAAIKVD